MQHFFNDASHVVVDVLYAAGHLAPLRIAEPQSGVRILIRRDWDRDTHGQRQVAVLSGGGAGHEPAHAGFIGEGMLTGVISGSLFASPSMNAVLAAIREVCGPAGCLLVVKNYTGDRLNFGLAAEHARREGLKVAMVIVADDISLPDTPQPRGLAGTLLIHKIAGYHAQQQDTLDDIQALAQHACERMASMGMALTPATLPGQTRPDRSPELGLGIHNEPGVQHIAPDSARDAMNHVVAPLADALDERGHTDGWLALLNNLGGCSTQEMGVLSGSLIDNLGPIQLPQLIGPAPLMTSLDMHGFSVTLMAADDAMRKALQAPTDAPAWPGVRDVRPPDTFTPRLATQGEALQDDAPQATHLTAALTQVLSVLRDARDDLDGLDARSGDGDAGSSLVEGADAIELALTAGRLDTAHPERLFAGLGQCLATGMGGSSGVLLSILFTATATALEQRGLIDSLWRGVERMQTYGGARLGDRTLLDALIPALQALQKDASLTDAAQAARQGAEHTATLSRARAGRAAYVPDSALEGVVDPGAEAVARVFETLARCL
ncbi:dihydroxyacetone kinase subunit DhaK [Chromohalobacter nigrandesensis]|uniref:dihydroxyacetone kinase subunit DhaK n=1 Tax=Chromohalobacter nigrandesensis TaxID=119863 RepID=UPI001FF45B8F|nr:dihydroxyacetone kinase subunit DhaK [Chromohalobacter nigrandesensis]MCK0746622.1 dihydroxyacetone kinase subunit DhaK [Chromohalobacter nigrandesensis]